MSLSTGLLGVVLAISAGLCGAAGSVCAKLAAASDAVPRLCLLTMELLSPYLGLSVKSSCLNTELPGRLFFFTLVFGFNALMWLLFTRSLQHCSATLHASVINTAANMMGTGALGWLLFSERLSSLWCCGAALIGTGVVLITSDAAGQRADADKKQK